MEEIGHLNAWLSWDFEMQIGSVTSVGGSILLLLGLQSPFQNVWSHPESWLGFQHMQTDGTYMFERWDGAFGFFPDECEIADVLNAEACCTQGYLHNTKNLTQNSRRERVFACSPHAAKTSGKWTRSIWCSASRCWESMDGLELKGCEAFLVPEEFEWCLLGCLQAEEVTMATPGCR